MVPPFSRRHFLAALPAAVLAKPGDKAFEHVQQLAQSPRVAGTGGEAKAAGYVAEQMRNAGLAVTVEPFRFHSFDLESAQIAAGEVKAGIQKLVFDPYSNGPSKGELAFVDSTNDMRAVLQMRLDGKIVTIPPAANLYRLGLTTRPAAIASLAQSEFDRIKASGTTSAEIVVRGRRTELSSANVVGLLSATASKQEIVVSAHYDSWRGPGAHDNASGVAVLLELARRFRALDPVLPVSLRFVAFGAEEIGMLGAKAYLDGHLEELRRCRLLFNIDSVGGDGKTYVELGRGVRKVPPVLGSQIPKARFDKATHDLDARWMLISPDQLPLYESSNVPDWLRAAVMEAGRQAGREITVSNQMGSDHLVFMQAGVVATNIAIVGDTKVHTLEDKPESVSREGLEAAFRIVASVVEQAARRSD